MKALCVKQPWSDLIASGTKTVELRTWANKYRGELLICASRDGKRSGETVCIVDLVSIDNIYTEDVAKAAAVPWEDGDDFYGWHLRLVRQVDRVSVKSKLGCSSHFRPTKECAICNHH